MLGIECRDRLPTLHLSFAEQGTAWRNVPRRLRGTLALSGDVLPDLSFALCWDRFENPPPVDTAKPHTARCTATCMHPHTHPSNHL